jgi:hypothetical protein
MTCWLAGLGLWLVASAGLGSLVGRLIRPYPHGAER